ncbi:DUF4179 domain-containing protein [Paenibacillus sp. WQ 127069]|uniref:DUF4179 domain-containing protein n=1 Tax=Paenibacillus baimaensis TaxID=2982185 RepID=A0ABT2U7Z0_9BACL|nr:DUF4179 domain-containing protein [Paenibacillus sp. WQ 127069]MCU6790740.1 DUF4179 domain-containing protein [Paenibacillus sp. WQ 127069]
MTLDSQSRQNLGMDLPPEVADAVQNRMSHLRPSVSFDTLWQRFEKSALGEPKVHHPGVKLVRRKWLLIVNAFVLCTVIVIGAWLLSPSVGAALQKSKFIELLYKSSGASFGNGLERIEQQNLSTQTNISVTDKDIRLTVADAFFDGVQIVVNYEVEFLKGKKNLTSDDAAVYYKLKMEDSHSAMMWTHVFTITGDHTFVGTTLLNTSVLSDNPQLTMLVERIGSIQGNWNVTIPLSTEKTAPLTTKFRPQTSGNYHDKHFTVDEIIFTPVSTQLIIKDDDIEGDLFYWIKDDLETRFEEGGGGGGYGERRLNFSPPSAINPKPAYVTLMINRTQIINAHDVIQRDIIADYTGTFPIVLEGNNGGIIKITGVQFLDDTTVVDYESSDSGNQLPFLLLEDSTGKRILASKRPVRAARDKYAYRVEYPRLESRSLTRFVNLVEEYVKELPKPIEVRIPLNWDHTKTPTSP